MKLRIETGGSSGRQVDLAGPQFVIGREPGCDLVLDDDRVSRQHARLDVLETGDVVLRDLGSANGTFVDEKRITGPVVLADGERMRVGGTVMSFSRSGAVAGTMLDPRTQQPSPPGPSTHPLPPDPSASTIERAHLRRSVKRSTVIALVAVAVAVLAVGGAVLAATGGGDSTSAVINDLKPSTVLVVGGSDSQRGGSGTGFVVDAAQGLVVTNFHVINGATEYKVGVGPDLRVARVVAAAPCDDLALLRIDKTEGLKTLPLGSQDRAHQGDKVVALGFPGNATVGDELQATEGVISVVKTKITGEIPRSFAVYQNVVQTDAAINPGNSGGPLVTAKRRLIGVTTIGSPGKSLQAYAIGVDRVAELLPKLRAGTSIGWIGNSFDFDDKVPNAIIATSAAPLTPARNVGFGDAPVLILAVNAVPVPTMKDYCRAVAGLEKNDTAKFTVLIPNADGTSKPREVEIPFG